MTDDEVPKTVPYEKFQETNRKLREAETRVRELEVTGVDSTKIAAELATLKTTHAALIARNVQDAAMLGSVADAPDLADPEVRDFVRQVYEQKQGEKPVFAEWLTEQRKTPSRLLKPYLTKPETATKTEDDAGSEYAAGTIKKPDAAAAGVGAGAGEAGAAGVGAGRPGTPNAGTVVAPGGRPQFTRADIMSMPLDEFRTHQAGIISAQRKGQIAS